MSVKGLLKYLTLVFFVVSPHLISAQTPSKPKRPNPPVKATTSVPSEPRPAATQVVTVVHRLNGLKMFRLLLRSEADLQAISKIDQTFSLMNDVHTNVIAGLALDDGQTVAAWLPEAELEFGPVTGFSTTPATTQTPSIFGEFTNSTPLAAAAQMASPELTVIGSDGKRWKAQYVGMDGITGLSILRLAAKNLEQAAWASDNGVSVGETVRLFGPEPVNSPKDVPSGSLFVRIGETNGTIWKVARTSGGDVAKFKMRSPRLNNMKVGGIALNTSGEAVGIVDSVEGTEATILPAELIRRAANRVLAQKSSVPKPWLGVKGEPVAAITSNQFENLGWESMNASTLLAGHRGILLTSIAPGSPAALAALKAGDVILKVNDEDIENGDDFSWQLDHSVPGKLIQFTIARPGAQNSETVSVKLAGALSPRLSFPRMNAVAGTSGFGLINQGLETIALRPAVAAQLGARAGLLVVYVEPETAAFAAGLRPGDVIQAIDGKTFPQINQSVVLTGAPSESHDFEIVRNRQKLTITVVNKQKNE